MSSLIDEIRAELHMYSGEWKEKKGLWKFSTTIAERKAFLTRKKLSYAASLRIDDSTKTLLFSEMLTESGSGFSAGGDSDGGISAGWGVKTETYNTIKGPRKGTIQEQSSLFGKDYTYQFDYSEVRAKVQAVAEKHGYHLAYQVLPVK